MSLNVQEVSLDITRRPTPQQVTLGQGDANATTLIVKVYDTGDEYDLDAYGVRLATRLPNSDNYYGVNGIAQGNVATFEIDETYAAATHGFDGYGYVEVLDGDTVICSTSRFQLVVLRSAEDGADPSTAYSNGIIEATERAIAAAEAAEGVVLQDVPTMSALIKGGAKLGSGLSVANDTLGVKATSNAQIDNIANGASVSGDESLSTSGLSRLWSKIKGLFVGRSDNLLTTNNFVTAANKGPYISKIDNALYCADKRWNVTLSGDYTSLSGKGALFDGNYDDRAFHVNDGQTAVVTIDFTSGPEGWGTFPGYPYGYILVSFYASGLPASLTGREYCTFASQGVGWKTITFTYLGGGVYISNNRQYYGISQIELTIAGQTITADPRATAITQIELHLNRPHPARNPFLSKYSAEKLYYSLTAPKFIGPLQGNADTATTAGNVTGTVAVANGGTGATTAAGARTNLSVPEYSSGVLNIGGTSAYLLFKTTAIASFAPPTGVDACMVLDTSDNGLYWYTA